MGQPDLTRPFPVPVEPRAAERVGAVDLYPPDTGGPSPAVVLVHGGPVPPDRRPTPRDWPVFRGYAGMLAERGALAAVLDHRMHSFTDLPLAAEDVAAAVRLVRADPRVAADRVAVWFFSGGGLLMADWLRRPPSWLRCVAASYPLLDALGDGQLDDRYRAVAAVADAGELPIVLIRVGHERPPIDATVTAFVDAATACGARLRVIDVPDGQHAFDMLDDGDQTRDAVHRAVDAVLAALTA